MLWPALGVVATRAACVPAAEIDGSQAVATSQPVTSVVHADPVLGSRFMRVSAPPGHFSVRYEATVDIAHHFESPARIEETAVARLPSEVLAFIYPSRYCQSDRLRRYAASPRLARAGFLAPVPAGRICE